jgi:hypothetical protein
MAILLSASAILFTSSGLLLASGLGPDGGLLQELMLVSMAVAGFVTISGTEDLG